MIFLLEYDKFAEGNFIPSFDDLIINFIKGILLDKMFGSTKIAILLVYKHTFMVYLNSRKSKANFTVRT